MIEAEIKRKIPKIDNWEDILTSNIFGLLDLIDNKYLLRIVSNATNIDGNTLSDTLKNKKIKNIELWKYFKNIGEPDILVTLNDDTFFIIEVKYFSHEHNSKKEILEDDNEDEQQEQGQLEKYLNIDIDNKKSDFIIYLTQDYQSLKVIQNNKQNSSNNVIDRIYHIHWNKFNEFFNELENIVGIEEKIIGKLVEYLDFKGFTYWNGFKYKTEYKNLNTKIGGFYDN